MQQTVNGELVSIGTEILLGEITDTNSVYLAKLLRGYGVNIFYMTSVGDNHGRIVSTIKQAMARSDLVITCGGLGPTVDDMTRQAVAEATGRALVFRQDLMDQIEARFKTFKVRMSENNRRQAYLPEGALVVENAVGTAPAFIVEHEGSVIVSLPGVPRELKFLMQEKIIPYLRAKYALGIIKAKVLHTAGIGESILDEMIGADLLEQSNPTVGLAAHNGQVDVRVTAKADSEDEADVMILEVEQHIRSRVGNWIYGADGDTLHGVFATLMRERELGLVVVQAGLDSGISAMLAKAEMGVTQAHFDTPEALGEEIGAMGGGMRDLVEQSAAIWQARYPGAVVIAIASQPDVDESHDAAESTAVCVMVGEQARTRVYGFGARSEVVQTWLKTWSLAQAWVMVKEMGGA